MAAHTAPKGRAGIRGEKSMAELVMMQKCSPVFMYSLSYSLVSTRIINTIKYLFNCTIPLTPKVRRQTLPQIAAVWYSKRKLPFWLLTSCCVTDWCSQCCLHSIRRTNDASKVAGATSHHWQLVEDLWHHCNGQAVASHCWPNTMDTRQHAQLRWTNLPMKMCLTLQLVPHLPESHPPESMQPLQPLQSPANASSLEVRQLKLFQKMMIQWQNPLFPMVLNFYFY